MWIVTACHLSPDVTLGYHITDSYIVTFCYLSSGHDP